MTKTRFYGIWKGIQGRCYCKTNKAHNGYGSDGIGSAWQDDFLRFRDDMYPSYMAHSILYGEWNTTIERKNNRKDYSKENCCWATQLEQANNKRNTMFLTVSGVKDSVQNLARKHGIAYSALRWRIQNGWDVKNLFIPSRIRRI